MKKEFIHKLLFSLAAAIFVMLMAINSLLVFTKTAIFPRDYQEKIYYHNDNIILNIILLIMFSIIVLLSINIIKKYVSVKRYVLFVMIYVFVVSIIFALLRRDFVQFDPFNVIDQASNFIRDNYSGLDKGKNYLYIYSHQITTVFIFQMILSTFGRATFILYIMQSFAIAYIIFLLYKLADVSFKREDINYLTITISALFFPLIFYVSFIYGTLPGMVLVLLTFYQLIQYTQDNRWYRLVICILSVNLAILLIGNNVIHLLAIFAVIFLYLFRKFDKKLLLFSFISILLMLQVPASIKNYYEVASGKEISQGVNKLSWIAMGMQEGDREAGWWNGFNYDIFIEENYDNDRVVEISKQVINQRINVFKNNPTYAMDFYQRKYENQFIDPMFQSLVITAPQKEIYESKTLLERVKHNSIEALYFGMTSRVIFYLMKSLQLFVYCFSFIASIILYKKKDELLMFVPIAFIGGTIFHMIWEAKSRYIFPYFTFLIPFAAYGFIVSLEYIKNRKEKTNEII